MDRRLASWTAAALALFGLLLLLPNAQDRELNSDEVYLALPARDGGQWAALTTDVHPPLYPLLLTGMTRLGLPEIAWRIVSLLFWLGAGVLIFFLGRLLGSDETGLLAMTLTVVSPLAFSVAVMVRSYSLACFLAAATLALTLLVLRRPSRARLAALAVTAALGCYTFYYNVYLVAALFLVGLVFWGRRHPAGRPLVGAALAAGLAFAPWLLVLFRQVGNATGGWIVWSPSPIRLFRRVGQILLDAGGAGGLEPAVRAVAPGAAGLLAALAAYLLVGWGLCRLARRETGREALWTLAAIIGLTIALALVAHFTAGSFVSLHYFLIPGAALSLPLAAPFALSSRRFLAGIAFGLLLGVNLIALPPAAREGREPSRRAAEWMDAHLDADSPVLGVAWFAVDGYRFYGRGNPTIAIPFDLRGEVHPVRAQAGLTGPADLAALRGRLRDAPEVGLLLSHAEWRDEDRGAAAVASTLIDLEFRLAAEDSWPLFTEKPAIRAQVWRRTAPVDLRPGTRSRPEDRLNGRESENSGFARRR